MYSVINLKFITWLSQFSDSEIFINHKKSVLEFDR